MSERESFVGMLDRAGVKWEQHNEAVVIEADGWPEDTPNKGYQGFFAEFVFSGDGRLESVGVWE